MTDNLLTAILNEFEVASGEVSEQRLRMSLSGKRARYLAHVLAGTEKGATRARTSVTFGVGDVVHDWFRDKLEESKRFDVLDRELELTSSLDGVEFTGHIDLRLVDTETDLIYLTDIKTVNLYSHLVTDPRNPHDGWWSRAHKWSAGNYSFDPVVAWGDEPFKGDYIYQIASYADACPFEFDKLLFTTICKDTGHIGIGEIDPEVTDLEPYIVERNKQFRQALALPDPYSHDLCYEPNTEEASSGRGSKKVTTTYDVPAIQCQYCPYTDMCFKTSVETVKGRPKIKIKEIL